MVGRLRPYLPLVLCFALCGIVFATLDDYGITWDEPEDSLTAEKHVSWFSKPTWSRIDPCWRTDEGHPPLGTLAGGIIQKFLSHRLGIMQPYKAFRLQALLYGFALNFVLFTWVTKYWGWATGLVAVLAFFFLPRAFFHAHLGVLDFPITAMWVVTAYAFWRGLENSRWMLVASALWDSRCSPRSTGCSSGRFCSHGSWSGSDPTCGGCCGGVSAGASRNARTSCATSFFSW